MNGSPRTSNRPSIGLAPVSGAATWTPSSGVNPLVPPVGFVLPGPAPTAALAAAPVDDPSLDAPGGARTILVTQLFGESVVGVHQLADPTSGHLRLLTVVALLVAAVTGLAGVVLLVGQPGLGAVLLLSAVALGSYGATRARAERRSPHLTVGEAADATCPLRDAALPGPAFPLVRAAGRDYELCFSAGMTGDVTVSDGARYTLAELAAGGQARPLAGVAQSCSVPIPAGARAKVDFGAHTFLVHSVIAPRPVTGTLLGNVEWQTQVFQSVSVGAHVLLLLLVFSVPPSMSRLSIDSFDTGSKLVRLVRIPHELKQETIPPWLAKHTAEGGPGTKQQKAVGPEGRAGKKESKKTVGRLAVKGPPQNQNLTAARELAERTAQTMGVLGVLGAKRGGPLAHLLGNDRAIGNDALDAMGGLLGPPGEAYGIGGLGLTGGGWGGGDGRGLIPYGGIDRIGDRLGGDGDGKWGPRGARLPTRKPTGGPPPAAKVVVHEGGLDKELIRREIRRHLNEVRYCYQNELQASPELGGRILVKFTIAGTGIVVASTVQETTMRNNTVESCLTQAVRRWTFPKPRGNGIVIVSYPFLFHAGEIGR